MDKLKLDNLNVPDETSATDKRDLQGGVDGIEELTEDMAVEVRTEFHKTESIF